MYDIRIYHAFGSGEVVREIVGTEADYETIKGVGLSLSSYISFLLLALYLSFIPCLLFFNFFGPFSRKGRNRADR
jgi:hypothetical protein